MTRTVRTHVKVWRSVERSSNPTRATTRVQSNLKRNSVTVGDAQLTSDEFESLYDFLQNSAGPPESCMESLSYSMAYSLAYSQHHDHDQHHQHHQQHYSMTYSQSYSATPQTAADMLAQFDTDKSGSLNEQEWTGGLRGVYMKFNNVIPSRKR